MVAFVLSGALAFALYELLAFAKWPPENNTLPLFGGTVTFTRTMARFVSNLLRFAIILAVLFSVLAVHELSSKFDTIARDQVNIVFGFLFGPLLAIWLNGVVVHDPEKDLSRGQVLSAIGLVLLFFLGATGKETTDLISRYAHSVKELKIPGAELSFVANERGERSGSLPVAGSAAGQPATAKYVAGGSSGLSYLAQLDAIIGRDQDYLTTLFAPKGTTVPTEDLHNAEIFAKRAIAPPLSCLLGWFGQTVDSGPINQHLAAYASAFRRLEALNTQINAPAADGSPAIQPSDQTAQLTAIARDFVRRGIAMGLDVASSTAQTDVLQQCHDWIDIYCSGDSAGGPKLQTCLEGRLKEIDNPSEANSPAAKRIAFLADHLQQSINQQHSADQRGLEALPYFAIARASLMAQLGQYEAAASILDDWLRQRGKKTADDPGQTAREGWLALRVRSMLAAYVEEWLELEGIKAATVVQDEHLKNLQAIRDGFKSRLLKADFFKELDGQCKSGCTAAFKRPGECASDEPGDKLKLFRSLYTSYITMETTYIDRSLQHPDYATTFADAINDDASRLVNFDLSCGADSPAREFVYAQALLAFSENGVSYARLRATTDSQEVRTRRLDEAERAAKFGLNILRKPAREEMQQEANKSYRERVAQRPDVQLQELLRAQLKAVDQARKEMAN
jgi:hypothetical protein